MKLQNAVALITGGAQGFGKKFAQNLLARGSRIVIADIDAGRANEFEEEVLAEYGKNNFKFIKCDVSDSNELNKTFDEAKDSFGRLDIICNNAGIMSTNVKRARKQVDINVTAVIEGTYKGIDLMSKHNGGHGGVIVNVASAAGLDLMKGAAVYTATKHAVVSFSRSFKLLPNNVIDGVRVNCICPYFCDTPMLRQGEAGNPEFVEMVKKIGGLVQIDDVAKAFMKCVEDDEMNGAAVVISPPNNIIELKFPKPVPKL